MMAGSPCEYCERKEECAGLSQTCTAYYVWFVRKWHEIRKMFLN